jgi:hypothetical protein
MERDFACELAVFDLSEADGIRIYSFFPSGKVQAKLINSVIFSIG